VATRDPGRILLMDDDPDVRGVAAAMLGVLGYAVECAADCAGTVAIYREALASGRRFDAVILDLTVAGGPGGREALALLQDIDPEVRAFASSGYSDDEVLADPPAFGFVAAIGKPYTVDQLADTLRTGLAPR
jgi:two-component system cell cycle sensor histidine kinase/response regulator CckA